MLGAWLRSAVRWSWPRIALVDAIVADRNRAHKHVRRARIVLASAERRRGRQARRGRPAGGVALTAALRRGRGRRLPARCHPQVRLPSPALIDQPASECRQLAKSRNPARISEARVRQVPSVGSRPLDRGSAAQAIAAGYGRRPKHLTTSSAAGPRPAPCASGRLAAGKNLSDSWRIFWLAAPTEYELLARERHVAAFRPMGNLFI